MKVFLLFLALPSSSRSEISISIRLLRSLFAAKQIRLIQGASTIITNYLSFSMFLIDSTFHSSLFFFVDWELYGSDGLAWS